MDEQRILHILRDLVGAALRGVDSNLLHALCEDLADIERAMGISEESLTPTKLLREKRGNRTEKV